LRLKTKAQKINISNGVVTGIVLDNGEMLTADAVVVTQETISAIDSLFSIPPNDKWLDDLRKNTTPVACTFISVGIRANIPSIPEWELKEPIFHARQKISRLGFNSYANYDGYAPDSCTALTTALMGDTYDFWKNAKQSSRYEEEKERLAVQISRAICQKYPEAEGKIEVIDISTPLTYERYTGAYRGSWMSVMKPGQKMNRYPGFSEDIKGLYYAGHRMTTPGGLPVAVESGRRAAQMVCRQFDVEFANF
jgi:phytoene dehydrogenase-like protein